MDSASECKEKVINWLFPAERTFSLVVMDQQLFIKKAKWKRLKRAVWNHKVMNNNKKDLFEDFWAISYAEE